MKSLSDLLLLSIEYYAKISQKYVVGCKELLLRPPLMLGKFCEINLVLSTNNPQKTTKELAKC